MVDLQTLEHLISTLPPDRQERIADQVLDELDQVLKNGSNHSPKPKVTKQRAPASRKGKGGKRSPTEIERDKSRIIRFLMKNPGSRAEDISAALKIEPKDLTLPLKKLYSEEKLTREGTARGTRYSLA